MKIIIKKKTVEEKKPIAFKRTPEEEKRQKEYECLSDRFYKIWIDYCSKRNNWKIPIEYGRVIAFDFYTKGCNFK